MGDEPAARDLDGVARDAAAFGGEEGERVPVGGFRLGGADVVIRRRNRERHDTEEVEADGQAKRQTNSAHSR